MSPYAFISYISSIIPSGLASVLWASLLSTGCLVDKRAVSLPNWSTLLLSWCRRVPVVYHLDREHKVENEASNKSVKDKWVIHLLDCCEDSGKRSGEVVEDL